MSGDTIVTPSPSPSALSNSTETVLEIAEEEHANDAMTALLINVTLIGCLLLAYYVKRFRIYYLPESAGALLMGVVVGGIARLWTDNLVLFEFVSLVAAAPSFVCWVECALVPHSLPPSRAQLVLFLCTCVAQILRERCAHILNLLQKHHHQSPEFFFFVLLPPIIFEAGYSLQRKDFFENVGAITLYAMVGTMISTFTVGGLVFLVARLRLIPDVDHENPMEALLFGALISAVDPVATLSIMGNAELRCDPLLYSLVFGESVLNDAVAISLFKVFSKYYSPDGPSLSESEIPAALWQFVTVSFCSVCTGVALGLAASFLYKHTLLSNYPHLETSLLFCFCYLCYAVAEAVGWSGIMSLFFQGMVLSHYNSYNLSPTAHVASEQIFSTLATICETVVFLYMGMGVFTGRFSKYDFFFSVLALGFCIVGRFLNIFPLSWLANLTRQQQQQRSTRQSSSSWLTNGSEQSQSSTGSNTASGSRRITLPMQFVLWFAGLRGAIAFALAMNMPGPNREVYATATLFICIFTTVVCGGLTDRMLTRYGMKLPDSSMDNASDRENEEEPEEEMRLNRLSYTPSPSPTLADSLSPANRFPFVRRTGRRVYKGAKLLWQQFDDEVLRVNFGGPNPSARRRRQHLNGHDNLGNYELGNINGENLSDEGDDDADESREEDKFIN